MSPRRFMTRRTPVIMILCFVLGLYVVFLHQRSAVSHSMWTTKDSWYRPLPLSANVAARSSGVKKTFYEVGPGVEAMCEALLQAQPIVPISPAQAWTFTSGSFRPLTGEQPFLVRVVCLNTVVYFATPVYNIEERTANHVSNP